MSTDMTEKILQEQAQEQAEQELFMMEFARAMKSMNLGLRHDRRVSDSIISKVDNERPCGSKDCCKQACRKDTPDGIHLL